MKWLTMIAPLVMVLVAVPAMAVKRTGNDLLIDCSNLIKTESMESVSRDKVLGMGYCIGLVDGMITFNYVYEAVLQREEKSDIVQMCLPERISTRQSAEAIVKFLEDNPGRLHESGQALAAHALVTAYPCSQDIVE
jgi:hypothetical protein